MGGGYRFRGRSRYFWGWWWEEFAGSVCEDLFIDSRVTWTGKFIYQTLVISEMLYWGIQNAK